MDCNPLCCGEFVRKILRGIKFYWVCTVYFHSRGSPLYSTSLGYLQRRINYSYNVDFSRYLDYRKNINKYN